MFSHETQSWASEGFFPGGGPIVDFPGVAKNIFPGGGQKW